MADWRSIDFAQLYGLPSKNGLMAPSKTRGSGALLVNMREIFAFDRISDQQMERAPLPERNAEAWLLRAGDLLFARQSLTLAGAGKVALVPAVPEPITFESHIIRVRLDPSKADAKFYYYLFRSSVGRSLIEGIVEQVAAAGIRSSDLGRLRVPNPDLGEQQRIAAVLGAFDDLIEANRSLITRLRALAIDVHYAASTGGEFVLFGEIATQIREGVLATELAAGTPYLGLEHFGTDGSGIMDRGDAGTVDSNKSRFRAGDVLYGKLRPYFRKVDRPGFDGVCSTEIWVIRPTHGWGAASLHAIVARPEFTEFAMAGNTGTRMPRANWAHVATMPVPVPPEHARRPLEHQLDSLWRGIVSLNVEITDLIRTRDELLPLLMSGKVRVSEDLVVS